MVRVFKTLASLCSYGSGQFLNRAGQFSSQSTLRRQTFDGVITRVVPWNSVRLSTSSSAYLMSEAGREASSPVNEVDDIVDWLVVGDGDLSYGSMIASDVASSANTRIIATVLEDEERHNKIYEHSKENANSIEGHSHQVKFGVDATNLPQYFPETTFDIIEFNFPHWRGKTNAKRNRELVDSFLKSASSVLKPTGEIRIALCLGQGGMPAASLDEWRQSWMPAMYAAEHGLMLTRLEQYEPQYGLSSHRGVDRPFFIGDNPQKYYFQFPNGESVQEDLQISCRHELRVMLHPEKLEESAVAYEDIVNGDAVLELGQEFIPNGIRLEIPARNLLMPYKQTGEHVPLAVFLLNYSGESQPLTRPAADQIRDKIEKEIPNRWGLEIAKGGRLVSRPYPYHLLPKVIKAYN